MVQRLLVIVSTLLLCLAVLALSFWRLTFPYPSKDESVRVARPASERLRELTTPPFLPDNPMYVVIMFQQRLEYLRSSPEDRIRLAIRYGDERLATAQLLLDRNRVSLAVTTITKAEKYLLTAAYDLARLESKDSLTLSATLKNTIGMHRDALIAMKPRLSDEQRATIDHLLEQLAVVEVNR